MVKWKEKTKLRGYDEYYKNTENILYEDKDVVVCCKPAGFPVQTRKPGCMDMESALRNYLAGKGQGTYLAVIHRLDQPVQGILVFAKNKGSAADLSQQIQQGKMEKKYLAYVQGKPEEKKGRLVNEMEKDSRTNTSRVVEKKTSSSKRAELDYCVLKETEEGSLVEIHLHTGRHHQIRVQMAYAGNLLSLEIRNITLKKRKRTSGSRLRCARISFLFFIRQQRKKWNFR